MPRRLPARSLAALLAGAGLVSCSLPEQQPAPDQAATETPAAPASTPGVPPVAPAMSVAEAKRVQSQVMDFADDLTIRLAESVDAIEQASPSIEARVIAHRLKYTVAQGATVIAASGNPRIALVDMLVMISLQRSLLERNIMPRHFGPESESLRRTFEAAEREIRGLAQASLSAELLAEIDRLTARWLEENPDRKYAAYVRLSDFAAARQASVQTQGGGRPSNVLGLLFIDPLAGLDPTTRELEQTRLFAERAFFYLQRMPVLISWQAELLYIDTVTEPEARRLIESATAAGDAAANVSAELTALREELPGMIAAERQAAIEQAAGVLAQEREAAIEQAGGVLARERRAAIEQAFTELRAEREATIEQLAAEQERLGAVVADLRGAIEATTTLSESLQRTAGGFNELATTIGLDEPKDPDAEPFRLADYTEAIRETTRAAGELNELTRSLTDATAPEMLEARLALIEARLADARSIADRVLWHAFLAGAGLIVLLVLGLSGVVWFNARLRR